MIPRKMKEVACPPECGFMMRWYEDDFTDKETKQLFDLAMKHAVHTHNYPDTPEVREKLHKSIKTVEK